MSREMIDTGATQVWIDDGIVHIRSTGLRSTSESVATTLAAVEKLTSGDPHPVLFDAREWPGGEPSAWLTVIEGMAERFKAAAILYDEGSPPDVGPYADTIDRLVIPFRTFADSAEALVFLESSR